MNWTYTHTHSHTHTHIQLEVKFLEASEAFYREEAQERLHELDIPHYLLYVERRFDEVTICMYVCLYACMFVYMNVCSFICMYVSLYAYTCMHHNGWFGRTAYFVLC